MRWSIASFARSSRRRRTACRYRSVRGRPPDRGRFPCCHASFMVRAYFTTGRRDMAAALENMLYLDVPAGRVVIELRPDLAPNHVARIKELARASFYDGIAFHRVIDGFMVQTGDPKGD